MKFNMTRKCNKYIYLLRFLKYHLHGNPNDDVRHSICDVAGSFIFSSGCLGVCNFLHCLRISQNRQFYQNVLPFILPYLDTIIYSEHILTLF